MLKWDTIGTDADWYCVLSFFSEMIRRVDHDLDIGLLKSRFATLNALCDDLEKLIKKPGQSKTELQVLLVNLKNELRLVEVAMPGEKLVPAIRNIDITPEELYILSFDDKDQFLNKALKGDTKSIIECIGAIRASISLWQMRVLPRLERVTNGGQKGKPAVKWLAGRQLRHKILRYLLDKEHDPKAGLADLTKIAADLGAREDEVDDQIDILDSQGAIKANRTFGGASPTLTGYGKAMLEELDEASLPRHESEQEPTPSIMQGGDQFEWDVFISHASEDKETFVKELANKLRENGLRVWYDEFTLSVGDSLRRSIDKGLARSRYGIVVLSPRFFAKEWPQKELDGLVARERNGQKVILPVWLDIDYEGVARYSPMLADRVAAKANEGLDIVVEKLMRVLRPTQTAVENEPVAFFLGCHVTQADVQQMAATLNGFVGLEYRAETASDLEAILGRAIRMVAERYGLIPEIAMKLSAFTVEADPSRRGFTIKGNPEVCLFAEQLIRGERPHIPELDS